MDMADDFAKAACAAVDFLRKGLEPEEAWEKATEGFSKVSNKNKVCPRLAFLGLCGNQKSKGLIRLKIERNKEYALKAVELLKSDPELADNEKELWRKVLEKLNQNPDRKKNHQMKIVIALWKANMIVSGPLPPKTAL
jgi:hypothetical protein